MRDRKVVEQIADVIRLCEDTDGLLIANRDGIVEFQRVFVDNLWKSARRWGCTSLSCILSWMRRAARLSRR